LPTNWCATLYRVYVHTVGHARSDTNSDVTKVTPWSRVLPEKLTGPPQLLRKLPAFYETRRFITASKKARHLSLSSARSIQSMPPHRTRRRSILICSIYAWVFHVVSLPQFSPLKPSMHLYSPHICYMLRPSQSSWSPGLYLERTREHEAPRYVFFSTPLLPRLS
jgi:hypothetical protein